MSELLHGKKIVLVIEDDHIVTRYLKELFEKAGITVHIAGDGEVANEVIKFEKPDFVILDVRLPKRDGVEVLRIMREDAGSKKIPVLVFTNFDLPEYRQKTTGLGILDFLTKVDVSLEAVVEKVVVFLKTGEWQQVL